MLTKDTPFDFEGEFYQVRGAFSGVKPVQAQARLHLRDLEQSIWRLREFRSSGERPAVRSIREDRFTDTSPTGASWEDDVLYLGLTVLARATPTLVGSPATIADAVLAYHDLGIGVVTLGSHVTSRRDAELRQETLRLIKQVVAGRDTAARHAA